MPKTQINSTQIRSINFTTTVMTGTLPIANGGTSGTTQDEALTALGFPNYLFDGATSASILQDETGLLLVAD
jgi:hypothetical protein